jgi:hypothetical protein
MSDSESLFISSVAMRNHQFSNAIRAERMPIGGRRDYRVSEAI